jgi:hypothetical protein
MSMVGGLVGRSIGNGYSGLQFPERYVEGTAAVFLPIAIPFYRSYISSIL